MWGRAQKRQAEGVGEEDTQAGGLGHAFMETLGTMDEDKGQRRKPSAHYSLSLLLSGGKLQFMVQGCENMCPSMNLFSHGTRMQIICCRNQSFCNKL